MKLKNAVLGRDMDRMPSIAFRIMSLFFAIRDLLVAPEKKLKNFNIKQGDVVIDYGCGPGGYIQAASNLVGDTGFVYGVDLHELAVQAVNERARKHKLHNVQAVMSNDYVCDIESGSADVIYALDMFHMVGDPDRFLKELHRLIKRSGRAYIEDGHQPREEAKVKIERSGLWEITNEIDTWMECRPV